jgi:hypothetical protein
MIASPMAPAVAAERILAAVETDRLYALTHGDFNDSVRRRAEGILAALHNQGWSDNHVETASNEGEEAQQRYADHSSGQRQDRTADLPISRQCIRVQWCCEWQTRVLARRRGGCHEFGRLPTVIRKFGGLFSSRSVGHSAHHHGIFYFSTGGTQVHWSNRHSAVNVTSLACSNGSNSRYATRAVKTREVDTINGRHS